MIFEELQNRYGPYTAERVREALTLDEFDALETGDLVPYFEDRAEKVFYEYHLRLVKPLPKYPANSNAEEYLNVLRRRWQDAEEIAYLVLAADTVANKEDKIASLRA